MSYKSLKLFTFFWDTLYNDNFLTRVQQKSNLSSFQSLAPGLTGSQACYAINTTMRRPGFTSQPDIEST